MRKLLLFLAFLPLSLFSQDLFLPVTTATDQLLDRLDCDHVIDLNSVQRPYSANLVAGYLQKAASDSLNFPSRSKEARFLLKNYSFPEKGMRWNLFSGRASFAHQKIKLAVVPLIRFQYWTTGVEKIELGAAVYGYFGKHLGFSLARYHGFQSEMLATPGMLTTEPGQIYHQFSDGSADYHEWTGQLVYTWNWGSFGLIKDRFEWGNNLHGANIFSPKPPSFPRIQLKVKPAKWIEFTWFHGRLNSDVVDSNEYLRSGDITYREKYIVANLLTVTPWKRLNVSLGNSAIYGDKIQAAYFIPVLFYKSVDHTLYPEPGATGGTNSQMFFDISSRQIRHLHLYMTLFVDEFKISRIRDSQENNFLGWKAGFTLWDFPIRNVSFTAEGTRTLPLVYQHNVELTTFANSSYNLGNYLRDNSQEIFLRLTWDPLSRLHLDLSFNYAEHADDFPYSEVQNPVTLPVLENIIWHRTALSLSGHFDLSPNSSIFISTGYSSTDGYSWFTPSSFQGDVVNLSLGVSVGL